MLTTQEVDEAEANSHEAKAEANSHEAEAEAKLALIFKPHFFYFDSIFSTQKKRNFRSVFDGTSKISTQNGLQHRNFISKKLKTTKYAFGRRLLLLCLTH